MLFLLGSGSLTLKGQNETFHTVSVENGLSNNFIRKIYKDSRGFTWVGTLNGLDRFDGISFKSYTPDNEQEITIYDMIETDPNSLWLGSNNGLWKFNYDSEKLNKTPFSEGKQFLCLGKDSKNNLIAGTSNGFYIISNEQPRFIPLNYHSEQQITIQGIYPDDNQTCWLSTSGGLYFCDYSTNEPLMTRYNSNITNNFQAIQKDGPTIYLGTRGFGIIKFDILAKQFTKYIDVGNDNILLLSKDNYNNLWVGTDGGGLIKISISKNKVTGSYRHDIQNTNSIASNAVYSFLEDNDMLWVGTYSNGLSYTINRLFKTYSFGSFSTKNLRVRSLYVRDNDKFIGSRDGFFYINDNKGK
jgi:ligand-binding sensor domain-containing protein